MEHLEAASILLGENQILILTHRRPDGDTIGCAAALCLGLRQIGKIAYVLPNEEAHGLFTPYLEDVLAPEGFTPTYVVTVDTASQELLPDSAQAYQDRVDLCIDHHGSNTGYAEKSCVVPAHAACGELVYLILKELCPITSRIAMLLYVAISTDTGCFMYSNTTAVTHRIAAELMEAGFDSAWVNKRHFRTKSLVRLRLESRMVQDMLLLDGGRTAITILSLEMLASLKATEEDLENIAAFLEQVEGVETAATIRELNPGEFKISLRTGGNLNASAVCGLLGGGGHPAAAGCTVFGTRDAAQEAIIAAIAQIQAASAP